MSVSNSEAVEGIHWLWAGSWRTLHMPAAHPRELRSLLYLLPNLKQPIYRRCRYAVAAVATVATALGRKQQIYTWLVSNVISSNHRFPSWIFLRCFDLCWFNSILLPRTKVSFAFNGKRLERCAVNDLWSVLSTSFVIIGNYDTGKSWELFVEKWKSVEELINLSFVLYKIYKKKVMRYRLCFFDK